MTKGERIFIGLLSVLVFSGLFYFFYTSWKNPVSRTGFDTLGGSSYEPEDFLNEEETLDEEDLEDEPAASTAPARSPSRTPGRSSR